MGGFPELELLEVLPEHVPEAVPVHDLDEHPEALLLWHLGSDKERRKKYIYF